VVTRLRESVRRVSDGDVFRASEHGNPCIWPFARLFFVGIDVWLGRLRDAPALRSGSFWSLLSAEFKPHGDVNGKGHKSKRRRSGGDGDGGDESVAKEASSLGDMIRPEKSDYSTVSCVCADGCAHVW
jgi:hypothetical protein